jgi:hypothetical protein
MFSEAINEVVRAFSSGANRTRTFEFDREVKAVVDAIVCGLVQLVPVANHTVALRDLDWRVIVGIELTARGEEYAATL